MLSESLPDFGEPYESDMSTPSTTEPGSSETTGSVENQGTSAGSSEIVSGTVSEISVDQLVNKLNGGDTLVLVDLRPASSFDKGHIEQAISVPVDDLPLRYRELPATREIIVYAECA